MKVIQPTLSALLLGLCVTAFSVQAQTTAPGGAMPNAQRSTPQINRDPATMSNPAVMTKDQIDAKYKDDKAACDAMKGNDKDVCIKEAKAARTSARADAEKARKNSKANRKATEEKSDAQYKVAKEKCDAMSGDAKDTCLNNVKMQYNK